MLLPAAAADTVVKGLKAEHRRLRRTLPEVADERFFKIKAPLFHIMWDELVGNAEPPELRTAEGDTLSLSEMEFDVPMAGVALVTLLREPDFEPGGAGQAVWMEAGPDGPRLLGDVTCDQGTLTLQALSGRTDRGRGRLTRFRSWPRGGSNRTGRGWTWTSRHSRA
jgi:hypothetical protein